MYEPCEDSYLLQDAIKEFCENKNIETEKISFTLDMGTGSGIQAEELLKFSKHVFAVEINEDTINKIKNKLNKKIKLIKSNLFENVKKQKFDLITFNPPYLPEDEFLKKDEETIGGITGIETTVEFLRQAKKYLGKKGVILFVASSFSNIKELEKKMLNLKYKFKQIKKKHVSFEDIFIYEAKLN